MRKAKIISTGEEVTFHMLYMDGDAIYERENGTMACIGFHNIQFLAPPSDPDLKEFTKAAMTGLCSEDAGNYITRNDVEKFLGLEEGVYDWKTHWPQYVGKMAVILAKATLSALNTTPE